MEMSNAKALRQGHSVLGSSKQPGWEAVEERIKKHSWGADVNLSVLDFSLYSFILEGEGFTQEKGNLFVIQRSGKTQLSR